MSDLESTGTEDTLIKNEIIYFTVDPNNPRLSYADLFEQHAKENDLILNEDSNS